MPVNIRLGKALVLAVMALFFCANARAHKPGLSTLFIELGTNRIHAQFILSWQELEESIPLDSNRDRTFSPEEFASAKARLIQLGEVALRLESDNRQLALKAPPAVQLDDITGVRFDLQYGFPQTRILGITSEVVAELQKGHTQIATVKRDGVTLLETVLDREKPLVELPLESTAPPQNFTARNFFTLGLEHIVVGWDHLAFLFGLLVVGGKLRDAIKIITSFTIAHSLTLALATLNLIRIPSSIVEPLIAASIVYVGFENILRDNFSKRWMLTFAFGLIHGCGFATILRELGVGANGGSVVQPLLWFNLGVEAGQLAIAALVLPLIWKLKGSFPKRWVPATSVALILLGTFFLAQRLFA